MVAHGWGCEKGHDKVGWKSPWTWPGFETLEESGVEPVDLFTASLLKLGALRKEEVQQFQMRADKVEKSALIRKLHEQLDTDRSGNISKAEMLAASRQPPAGSRQPMLLQALSRLIVRYESEWGRRYCFDPLYISIQGRGVRLKLGDHPIDADDGEFFRGEVLKDDLDDLNRLLSG